MLRVMRWAAAAGILVLLGLTCLDLLSNIESAFFRFENAAAATKTTVQSVLPPSASSIRVATCIDSGEEWVRFDFVRTELRGGLPEAAIEVPRTALQLPPRAAPDWWWDDWWPNGWLGDVLASRTGAGQGVRFFRWRYSHWDRERLAQALLDFDAGIGYLWTDSVREPWTPDPWSLTATSTISVPAEGAVD